MKKTLFGVLAFILAFYCGSAMAEVKVRLDFEIDNPDAIINEACRVLVEEFGANFNPPRSDITDKYANFDKSRDEYYISALRGEHGDLVVFIVPDEAPDCYDIAALGYPGLDLVLVGGVVIKPDEWDIYCERILEELDPAGMPAGTGERVWDVWEVGEESFVFVDAEDANVYAEPNSQADIVTTLPNDTRVYIDRVRVLTDGKEEDFEIFDAWWYITSPVEGWVKELDLGLGNSGYLYGM